MRKHEQWIAQNAPSDDETAPAEGCGGQAAEAAEAGEATFREVCGACALKHRSRRKLLVPSMSLS